jgi:proteasome lid subunit RPN8/RPN11
MGLFGRKKGKWRTIREDYRSLPRPEWTRDEEAHFFTTCSEDEYWHDWEVWSRQTVAHPSIKKIRQNVIDMARRAAAETDGTATAEAAAAGVTVREDGGKPGAEFACLLEVRDDTITELVMIPGTVSGDEHAIFNLWMQPVDRTVRGSLHSHPDEHPYPSDADFELFSAHGEIHLILCRPYGPDDWRAYAHDGMPTHLEVV